jgi:hypothetical protein
MHRARQQVVAEVVIDLVVEVEDLRLLERPRLGLVAEDFARALLGEGLGVEFSQPRRHQRPPAAATL